MTYLLPQEWPGWAGVKDDVIDDVSNLSQTTSSISGAMLGYEIIYVLLRHVHLPDAESMKLPGQHEGSAVIPYP